MNYGQRKWRKGSVFGAGTRVPMDREQKAQFKARLHLQRRPGRVSLAAEKIALILVGKIGEDGALCPSHETLAAHASINIATVKRGLERLRLCGFLDWTRRLIRSAATGWRCEQTSNAYVLRLPTCEAHFARPVPLIRFKKEKASGLGRMTDAEGFANRDRQLRALGFTNLPGRELATPTGLPPCPSSAPRRLG